MDEAVTDVQEAVVAPQDAVHEEVTQAQPQVSIDDRQERNWREMRKSQDELRQLARSQAEMIAQLKAQLSPQEKDEFDSINDEDYISAGKVKKLIEKKASQIAEKAAKEHAEQFIKQQEQSQFLDRLKRQFSDFDDVVNAETISILEKQDPDLANTIAEMKDPYKIGLQSYKYIKALGLAEKAPVVRRAAEVEKKLEKNAKTVQTPQAYEKRPMAQAFKMTEAEKTALYREMMEHAKGSGYSY